MTFPTNETDGDGGSSGEPDRQDDYVVEEVREEIDSSRGHQLTVMENDLGIRRKFSPPPAPGGLFIEPNNWWYKAWDKCILLWAIYSSFFTPFEFGFFRGLPRKLFFLDNVAQIAFLVDMILQFFVTYRDSQSYKMVYSHRKIAHRYLRSHFIPDFIGLFPWDVIYMSFGRKEGVRYMLWIRLTRARRLITFLQRMEKDIRINYLLTRIVKLIVVELYCTHTAACIFYYLATTVPEEQEGNTWIGSLTMGSFSYKNFREINLWTRYITSLYFSIVTMVTVGYGDAHAVNVREMIFVMIYASFNMVLGAYLIGNITALIVKGSKTERFRDRMTDLTKFMNRNGLGRELRDQIKRHLRLQYECTYTDPTVLRDIPISIRAEISHKLYKSYVENVPLFRGCSSEFINQIVTRVHEEFFLPGELIVEQGNAVEQLYIVCHGLVEEVCICADGSEEIVSLLGPCSIFGEISILCSIPQPYTVRVYELCRFLRIDKMSFLNILEIYFYDGRKVLTNLLEQKESNLRVKQLESDITSHIGKQKGELALKVNNTVHYGDLDQFKKLIRAGADPNMKDYHGISPLHMAASRGHEGITLFLLQEGADINAQDNFGNTPLLEAIKNGYDRIASILSERGALLKIEDTGSYLCSLVARTEGDLLRRMLSNGADPNSEDYDSRTPLHIAASQGMYLIAKMLIEAGASVFNKDRWGNTPLDEGQRSGNGNMIKLLEEAKKIQLSKLSVAEEKVEGKKKCTVFPFHPWVAEEKRRNGVVLWVPSSIQEIINEASKRMEMQCGVEYFIVSEDGGKISDADMIVDGQKLYLVTDEH